MRWWRAASGPGWPWRWSATIRRRRCTFAARSRPARRWASSRSSSGCRPRRPPRTCRPWSMGGRPAVTIAHSRPVDLQDLVLQADLLVAAVGRRHLVQGTWLKPGAVVIDVGMNQGPDGKLAGDVDFASAVGHVAAITPVPGGVGPMT